MLLFTHNKNIKLINFKILNFDQVFESLFQINFFIILWFASPILPKLLKTQRFIKKFLN